MSSGINVIPLFAPPLCSPPLSVSFHAQTVYNCTIPETSDTKADTLNTVSKLKNSDTSEKTADRFDTTPTTSTSALLRPPPPPPSFSHPNPPVHPSFSPSLSSSFPPSFPLFLSLPPPLLTSLSLSLSPLSLARSLPFLISRSFSGLLPSSSIFHVFRVPCNACNACMTSFFRSRSPCPSPLPPYPLPARSRSLSPSLSLCESWWQRSRPSTFTTDTSRQVIHTRANMRTTSML